VPSLCPLVCWPCASLLFPGISAGNLPVRLGSSHAAYLQTATCMHDFMSLHAPTRPALHVVRQLSPWASLRTVTYYSGSRSRRREREKKGPALFATYGKVKLQDVEVHGPPFLLAEVYFIIMEYSLALSQVSGTFVHHRLPRVSRSSPGCTTSRSLTQVLELSQRYLATS
jgi:hypothetical protein